MTWVTTREDATELLQRLNLRNECICGIDCETEGIDPRTQPAAGPHGRIVCWTLAWDDQVAGIWANRGTWGVLGSHLGTLPVVGHNVFGFDYHMFRKAGYPLGNIVGDTLRMSKLINPDGDAEHNLKSLMKWWLKMEPVGEFRDLFARRADRGVVDEPEKTTRRKIDGQWVPTLVGGPTTRLGTGTAPVALSEVPTLYPELLPVLYEYAVLDARATLLLWRLFREKMIATSWEAPLWTHTKILDSRNDSGPKLSEQPKAAGSGARTSTPTGTVSSGGKAPQSSYTG